MTSMEIAGASEEIISIDDTFESATFEELVNVLTVEHGAVQWSVDTIARIAQDGALHAIRAGTALIEIQRRGGDWRQITADAGIGPKIADRYKRIAHYRAEVAQWLAAGGNGTFKGAEALLRGMPARTAVIKSELKPEAQRLRANGLGWKSIAKILGVGDHTVRYWCDDDYRKRKDRQGGERRRAAAEERKLVARARRAEMVKKTGGSIAHAYEHARKCALALDQAIADATNEESRDALRRARAALHNADDQIVRASKVA